MEVPGEKELDLDNMEIGDTYLETWRPHLRDDKTRLIHGRHKGTNNAY